jgi:hypothetical protein
VIVAIDGQLTESQMMEAVNRSAQIPAMQTNIQNAQNMANEAKADVSNHEARILALEQTGTGADMPEPPADGVPRLRQRNEGQPSGNWANIPLLSASGLVNIINEVMN